MQTPTSRHGQATVIAWDRDTLANQIEYRGGVLTDVPVMGDPDARVVRAGDRVAVMCWGAQREHLAVLGRVISCQPTT